MKPMLQTRFRTMITALSERWHLVLENLALHHQVAVLQRSATRPQFSTADRFFWMLLSTVWSRWQDTLKIVQADTVRRWRRQGFRQLLAWRRGHTRPGRPPIPGETQALIRRMSRDNGMWGAPRIQSELALLGINVSRTTGAKYMDRRPGPPSQTWRTFWHNHASHLIATVTCTAFIQSFRALSEAAVQGLRRWRHRVVVRRLRRFVQRPALASTPSNDITPVCRIWHLKIVDGIQASERSPPASISFIQKNCVALNRPLDTLTSQLRPASFAIEHPERYPVRLRQSRRLAEARARAVSQRNAA